mgnify:FL=1
MELTAAYQPINCDSLKAELEILAQNGYSDDLFLAQKDRFRLMALSEVYTAGSDANRLLSMFEVQTCWPVLTLLLHAEYMEGDVHRGSVILMDYPELVRDVALFDRLPNTQRERHIKQMMSRCLRYAPQCSIVELIEYLKTGRCD